MKTIKLIIHNVRSVYNVGAMFRTADAAGVAEIFLTGYTPAPLDRFGKKRKDFAKSALGAEESMSWQTAKNLSALISKLKREDFFIIAIEQDKRAVDYKKIAAQISAKGGPASGWNKIALLVGSEVEGLPKNILSKCDLIAEIPMKGKKESLNVSVAFGIALFRILEV